MTIHQNQRKEVQKPPVGQHIRDKIIPVLLLLQATERHLGPGDVLLWVLEILKLRATILHQQTHTIVKDGQHSFETHQSGLGPDNTLLLVGIGVLEALDHAGLASEQAVEVWANFVGAALLESVALGTTSLEQVCTLGVGAL